MPDKANQAIKSWNAATIPSYPGLANIANAVIAIATDATIATINLFSPLFVTVAP
jgi:hypothetical protein